jgi:hypothetical protein
MICQHHWLIAFPKGPTSRGECLKCHEEREFLNSQDDYEPRSLTLAHYKLRLAEAYRE